MSDDQRQLNKIFLQEHACKSDYIISPIDKHETQRSSVSTVLPLRMLLGLNYCGLALGGLSLLRLGFWSLDGSTQPRSEGSDQCFPVC